MKTLKQTVETLKSILSTNPIYNFTGEGSVWEFDAVEKKYPCTWIDTESNLHTINNSSVVYIIDVYFIDLVYKDERENELNIKSDTFDSAVDLTIFLKNNMEALDFYVKDGFYTAQVFSEKWTDAVAGTKLTLTLTIKGAGSTCKNIFKLP